MVRFLLRVFANSYIKLLALLSALLFYGYVYFLSITLKSDICFSQQIMCLSAGIPYGIISTVCTTQSGDACVNGYASSCLLKYEYTKEHLLSMWSPSSHEYVPYGLAIICLSCIAFSFEFISYLYGPEVSGVRGGFLGIIKILSAGPLPLITVFLILLSAKEFVFIFQENCKSNSNPHCSTIENCGVNIRLVLLTTDYFVLNFGSFAVSMAVTLLIGSALSIWGHAVIERDYILANRENNIGARMEALMKAWKVVEVPPADGDECPICLRSMSPPTIGATSSSMQAVTLTGASAGTSSGSSVRSIRMSIGRNTVHPNPIDSVSSPGSSDPALENIESASGERQPNINNMDTTLVQTPCNHVFHKQCVSEWAVRNDNCPVCRTDFTRRTVDGPAVVASANNHINSTALGLIN